jgi:hypothetical protein
MLERQWCPTHLAPNVFLRKKHTFKTWRPYKRWCNFKALNVSLWWPLLASLGISRFNTQVLFIIYIHHASIYNPFWSFIAIAFLLHLPVNFKFHVKPSPDHIYNKTRTLIIMKTTTINKVEQKQLWKNHNKDDDTKFCKQCTFH